LVIRGGGDVVVLFATSGKRTTTASEHDGLGVVDDGPQSFALSHAATYNRVILAVQNR
jgi:hypothetical protein